LIVSNYASRTGLLLRLGHKTLAREGWSDYVFAFHGSDVIGPKMLSRIAKHSGLTPEDL